MTEIITVHGTFAGDPSDSGEKWWQRGSPFLASLQQYLRDPLKVTPFHWSGRNSEMDRRKTGSALGKTIRKAPAPPIVLAHSHGASSMIHALLMERTRDPKRGLERVRGFVSIGMPMVRFRSNRNPLSWFDVTGRLLLLAILGIIAGYFVQNFEDAVRDPTLLIAGSSEGYLSWLPPSELVLGGVMLAIFAWYGRMNVRRQRAFAANELAGAFGKRHVALNHSDDEAINALSEGLKVRPKMIRGGTMFVNVFSTAAFLLVANIYAHLIGSDLARKSLEPSPGAYESAQSLLNLGFGFPAAPAAIVDESAPRPASPMIFTQRLETRAPLVVTPLRSVVDQLDQETYRRTWFHKHFDSMVDEVHLLAPDGDAAEMPARFLAAFDLPLFAGLEELFDGSLESAPLFLAEAVLVQTAPVFVFGPSPAGAMAGADGRRVLAVETDILAPTTQMMEIKWACRHILFPDLLPGEPGAGEADDRCRLFDFGYVGVVEFFAVAAHGAYNGLLTAFYDSELVNAAYLGTGLDFGVVLENVALLVPILILAALLALAGMVVLTPLANAFLVNTVKGTAYGNDGYGERPVSVSPSLDFTAKTIGTLPAEVEEEMNMNSAADAPAAIERFRQILSSGALTAGSPDADALKMAMTFDRSELLHNAYFQSDLFVKHLAVVLVERFGLEPSAAYREDPDMAALAARFAAVAEASAPGFRPA